MSVAPITLFVYNRPVHTRRTVDALLRNTLAAQSDLIIYSDAPRQPKNEDAVSAVRAYLKTITGFRSISIVERERNWGLANSIIDGVTSIVNKHGRIIVLEDDLVVSQHFLEYVNTALDRYEREHGVMQVAGYMFPVFVEVSEDAMLLPLTTSWGWATWARAWRHFDPSVTTWSQIKGNAEQVKSFDLGGAYPYSSMIEAQFRGEIDSWAIRWYASVFAQKGLVLFPRETLVFNSGLEGSGTHGKGPANWRTHCPPDHFSVGIFPQEIAESPVFPLVAQAIAKRQESSFNGVRRWLHGIMAKAQGRD